ncbi:hypothetical protein SYNPS1DRAFT_30352 [Syncephalis pseudoplumigaleata]|uniref:Uncharacterized protein n=1 Tax=Syncephalis pseudoplumigaleata TaxID=1712513 RepID=A0A4P9YVP3_9FUNG|nr:hypothetical protein SYNPS1DRAFT_30352 [Syncephalis pseudoplumigaleata]|eukprot:RKP23888.1 hypothetical protein SYNPS1DRAFT_30352 [Syncephalis pseudoplumigaleata]
MRIVGWAMACLLAMQVVHPVHASITFYNNITRRLVSYPTFDLFEANFWPYKFSGLAINPSFAEDGSCTLVHPNKTASFHNPLNIHGVPEYKEMVIIIDDLDARDYGCKTITQVAMVVQAYGEELYQHYNYPPTKALLYALVHAYDGVAGAPTTIMDSSTSPSIPDDMPPIPVALLADRFFNDFAKAYDADRPVECSLPVRWISRVQHTVGDRGRAHPPVWPASPSLPHSERHILLRQTQHHLPAGPGGDSAIDRGLPHEDVVAQEQRAAARKLDTARHHLPLAAAGLVPGHQCSRDEAAIPVQDEHPRLPRAPNVDMHPHRCPGLCGAHAARAHRPLVFRQHLRKWSGSHYTVQALRKLLRISVVCVFSQVVICICNILSLARPLTLYPEGLLTWVIFRHAGYLLRAFTLLMVVGVSGHDGARSTHETFKVVRNFFHGYSMRSKPAQESSVASSAYDQHHPPSPRWKRDAAAQDGMV